MSVTPSGSVAVPIYLLRRMVSLSTTFQTATGAASATLALNHIYLHEATGDETRPCAVVNGDDTSYELSAGGDQNQLRAKGSLFLWLAQDTLSEHYEDNASAVLRFANYAGGVADDVIAIAGQDQTADATITGSHLSITGMQMLAMSEIPREMWPEVGRFWWCAWQVTWGDE